MKRNAIRLASRVRLSKAPLGSTLRNHLGAAGVVCAYPPSTPTDGGAPKWLIVRFDDIEGARTVKRAWLSHE